MKIITLDFETYYDRIFTLSKLTTEEYIRDERFETIGVSVQEDDSSASSSTWFSGSPKETQEFLEQFDWENSLTVAHNAMFDMAILNWRFGIRPKRIADTLSMARAIHGTQVGGSLKALAEHYGIGKKGTEIVNALGKHREDFSVEDLEAYAGYCKNDSAITYKLFNCLMAEGFPLQELKLIDLTLRMFTEPVLEVGTFLLEARLEELKEQKAELLGEAGVTREQIMSNLQFAELLKAQGVLPPTKVSLTTGKETLAFAKTDEAFQALKEHNNPVVQILMAARLGVKSTIEVTRTERFIGIGKRGTLPIPLRYYAAHTGRWGGDDKINMQNLPGGSILKNAMLAPKGFSFLDCDSSQIEARTLAWLAEQNNLVDTFSKGEDVYKVMASAIYGKPVEDITKEERFVGKTTILGCGYGMGAVRFQAQLKTFYVDLELEECERIIRIYRAANPDITRLWRTCNDALSAMVKDQNVTVGTGGLLKVEGKNGIRLPNGLYIKYPNLRFQLDEDSGRRELVYDTKKGKSVIPTRIYGGKVVENVCQALARILIGHHLLLAAKKYKVVMTVHDALGCIAPEKEAEEALDYVYSCMRQKPDWAEGLPLDCEGGFGASYGEC
jgi:DNA polymerase I-like protein with 3'-5' exonuclease and polymerase domains|tara:strand:- start:128 stop:1966 length:1839 start_codon:yes stop_codon:yes gene_type:complete